MQIKNSTLKAFAELCEKPNGGYDQLKYIHIAKDHIEATNSYILGFANHDLKWDLSVESVNVSAEVAKKLPLKGVSEITETESGMFILNGETILMQPERTYPNTKSLRQSLEESQESSPKLHNDYLKQLVAFVSKFETNDKKLEFKFLKNNMGEVTNESKEFTIRFMGR